MKIYLNNKVYVSKKDILYVLTHENNVSVSIRKSIFIQNNHDERLVVSSENQDEFFIFDTDEAKDYFRKLDYILNFGSYIKCDVDYLKKMLETVKNHKIDLLDTFCKYDEQTKIANMGLRKQIDDLNIFLTSLNDLIEIKTNKSRIILPVRERKNYYQEKEQKAKEFLHKMMTPIKYI